MTQSWSSPVTLGLDAIDRIQRGLVVSMIMTPRDQVMTCMKSDSVAAVMERNIERYSFIPVVCDDDRYRGVFDASQWFDKPPSSHPVEHDFQPLSEDFMIGADASIFEFVVSADKRPMRLVVSRNEIAGVISLSDLQQLPVRAALFTLITALEIAMARRIEVEWQQDKQSWKQLISAERRDAIEAKIKEVREADGYVSDIALSQFADKATVIRKARLVEGEGLSIKRRLKAVEELRNDLAHSNSYAETPENAQKVCEVVRSILHIKSELMTGISERHPGESAQP